MKPKSGIFTNILFLIIGVLLGAFASWIISNHFYRESTEDKKRALIESAIHEIQLNITHDMYSEYRDTAQYRTAGRGLSYLQVGALHQLYLNIGIFKYSNSPLFADFEENLIRAKISVEIFNQFVEFRNNYILEHIKSSIVFDPTIFQQYNNRVLPSIKRLKEFLIRNKESLVK